MFFDPLPHNVRIERITTDRDGSGGTVYNTAVRHADVACLISSASGKIDQRFDGQRPVIDYTVSFPKTSVDGTEQSAEIGDMVYVTNGPRTGSYFRVNGISESGPGAFLIEPFIRLRCEELRRA